MGKTCTGLLIPLTVIFAVQSRASSTQAPAAAEFWEAARKGDVKQIADLLAKGVDINARTRYGATALWFAAYKGRLEAVKLLIERKAALDHRDTAWGMSALDWAAGADFADIVKVLLAAGAKGGETVLQNAASQKNVKILRAALETTKFTPDALSAALVLAPANPAELRELLKNAGAKTLFRADLYPPDMKLSSFTGAFETSGGSVLKISARNDILQANSGLTGPLVLRSDGDIFKPIGNEAISLRFERKGEAVAKVILKLGSVESIFERQPAEKRPQPKAGVVADISVPVTRPQNWPSFRGINASGIADGQHPPSAWDVKTGRNVLWTAAVPGLAHSSPIVWGDRLIVTTAVRLQGKSELKPGLYGAGAAADDMSPHRFQVLCLDMRSGKAVWERTAHEGIPKVKRHTKATHANATPATDGKHIVVSFASEGLYCYDFAGKLLWMRDLGVQNAGAFNDPELEWGAASSPIIFRNLVIVQYDRHKDSYIAAFDVETGSPLWRTPRDEHPSWGSPTVVEGPDRLELITNGTNFIRGYDPSSGKELWRLGGNSEITVPTPFVSDGLIFVTNGYRPIQPIYAIRPGALGDISVKKDTDANENVAWSKQRGGPYMPTPLVYGGRLYVCTNNGVVTCYEARTGKQLYRQRLGSTGGHSASLVAADGRIYITSEEGDVYVLKAGPAFELLAINKIGEACLATPAISNGMIFVRSQHHLFGIGYK